jgi:hypothetical protein
MWFIAIPRVLCWNLLFIQAQQVLEFLDARSWILFQRWSLFAFHAGACSDPSG